MHGPSSIASLQKQSAYVTPHDPSFYNLQARYIRSIRCLERSVLYLGEYIGGVLLNPKATHSRYVL